MSWAYLKLKTAAATIRTAVSREAGPIPNLADETIQIPSRDKKRMITVDVYRPSITSIGSSSSAGYLVNFFGSYFVVDALKRSDVQFLRRMAQKTGFTVYDVHYRLAPEHPFPAAFEDGEDVIKSLPASAPVAVSGFAAGGNIALSLSCASSIAKRVKSVFTMYPVVDFSRRESKLRAPDTSSPAKMPVEAAALMNDCYLYGGVDPKDPRVSPLNAPATSFPQDVFLYTAAQDAHCLPGEELVQHLQKGGAQSVRHKRFEGCGVFFDKDAPQGSVREQAAEEAYAVYEKHLTGITARALAQSTADISIMPESIKDTAVFPTAGITVRA